MRCACQVALAALVLTSNPSAFALDIIWVSDGRSPARADAYSSATAQGWTIQNPLDNVPYDQGWVNMLIADGHNVDYRINSSTGDAAADWNTNGAWQGTLSQNQKDNLNAADLIVVSPDINGVQYNRGDTGRLDWNAITTPLLSLTPQTMTQDVWWWNDRTLGAHVHDYNLLTNNASGVPSNNLPPGFLHEPYYMQALVGGTLRSSNDTVQWDILDETSGSQAFTYTTASWRDMLFDNSSPESCDSGFCDWTRLVAATGDTVHDDAQWTAPTPTEGATLLAWHMRWGTGQQWCQEGCDPLDTPPPAGHREMFNAAGAENDDVGGFYQGRGQENLNTAGEAIFLDLVERVAAPDLTALRQNRQAPQFTPTIDGAVTAMELSSQLRVPMTVARDGVANEDQMRGGAVLLSSNRQNGMLPEPPLSSPISETCESCDFDPSELSGNFYVSWDADNLYVTTVVKDDSPNAFLFQDERYVFDASLLPQDGVGFLFNPNDDPEGGAKAAYEATVQTDDGTGPSILRNGVTTNAQLTADGVVIAGQATTDGEGAVDGYILEMEIPWEVAMAGADGANYIPSPGDEHGLSFLLSGWNGFDFSPSSRQNHKGLFADFGHGTTTHNTSAQDPMFDPRLDVFDQTIWNLITLAATSEFSADFDFDGDVDDADLAILESGYGAFAGDASQGDGDADGDGVVGGKDALLWQRQFGSISGSASAATIPEPSSAHLFLFAALAWRGRRIRLGDS
ncbi:sugar-binding protein [Pirellulales bacterium]|nr:sugar-binding protein [Pirellulales bacterium]